MKIFDGWVQNATIIQVLQLIFFTNTTILTFAFFFVLGFKKFIANRGYEGEIALELDDSINLNPNDGVLCLENCQRCSDSVNFNKRIKYVINDVNKNVECDKKEATGATSTNKNTGISYSSDDSYINSIKQEPIQNNLRFSNGVECGDSSGIKDATPHKNIENSSKWKIIKGTFFMVNGANISCACARCPNGFSKYSHIGDGYVDLLIIRHTSMLNNLRLLLKLSSQNGEIVSFTINPTRTFCINI